MANDRILAALENLPPSFRVLGARLHSYGHGIRMPEGYLSEGSNFCVVKIDLSRAPYPSVWIMEENDLSDEIEIIASGVPNYSFRRLPLERSYLLAKTPHRDDFRSIEALALRAELDKDGLVRAGWKDVSAQTRRPSNYFRHVTPSGFADQVRPVIDGYAQLGREVCGGIGGPQIEMSGPRAGQLETQTVIGVGLAWHNPGNENSRNEKEMLIPILALHDSDRQEYNPKWEQFYPPWHMEPTKEIRQKALRGHDARALARTAAAARIKLVPA